VLTDQRNGLNQLFVKRAWGWITAIFIFHSLALFLTAPLLTVNTSKKQDSSPPSQPAIQLSSAAKTPFNLLVTSLRRYLLSSLFWFYLTQKTWFGTTTGPSISHRILRTSGAICVPSNLSSSSPHSTTETIASAICTGAPGEYWRGGHDVSGHSFMMIHCSMFLFELVHPLLPSLLPKFFASTSTRTQPRKLPLGVDFDRSHGVVLVDVVDDEFVLPLSVGEIEWSSVRSFGLVGRRSLSSLSAPASSSPALYMSHCPLGKPYTLSSS
jgi:hypothetical protein